MDEEKPKNVLEIMQYVGMRFVQKKKDGSQVDLTPDIAEAWQNKGFYSKHARPAKPSAEICVISSNPDVAKGLQNLFKQEVDLEINDIAEVLRGNDPIRLNEQAPPVKFSVEPGRTFAHRAKILHLVGLRPPGT